MAEETAFQRGYDAGILFVASSGNGYDTNPVDGLAFPAGYPTVMSVGAVDSTSTIASFSQRGPDLKVVAPGVDVLSTWVNVHEVDGVSGATPQGIDSAADLPKITQSLLERGYSATDIHKILGGNLLRVFRQAERVSREMQAQTAAAK